MPAKKARTDVERRLRQSSRLARVLRLLALLRGRGSGDIKDLAHEQECSGRTVHRDLEVLTMAGVPHYFDKALRSYRLREGSQLPALHLTNEELIGQALATAATSVAGLKVGVGAKPTTRKIAAKLSDEGQQILADAEQLIVVLDLKLADHSRKHEILRTIQWSLLQRRQVAGQYTTPYQEKPRRLRLHPIRLCLVQHAWYLIARPTSEQQPKTYRVARFRSLRMLDTSADVPNDFSLTDYFGNAWAVFRGEPTYDIEILFTADAATQVTETQWHPTQQVKHHPDGSVTLTFRIDGLDEILWWLLGWSGFATVVKPVELREMLLDQLNAGSRLNEIPLNSSSHS